MTFFANLSAASNKNTRQERTGLQLNNPYRTFVEDALMVAPNDNYQQQIPLIQIIESDDLCLQDQPDVLWFKVLRKLDYHDFQTTAARYYEQLFTFNQRQKQQRIQRRENPPAPNLESRQQAALRLLFERATLDDQIPTLPRPATSDAPLTHVATHEVRPGVTPRRFVGRPPKCFFAMTYAFVGTMLAGQPPEPEFVHQRLSENPAFARTCGFTMARSHQPGHPNDIPSLRKLQQFDQIMTDSGLWAELALDRVADNLREGRVKKENTLVHDTTHYHAFSSMTVAEIPETTGQGESHNTPETDRNDSQDLPKPAAPKTPLAKQAKPKSKAKKPKRKSHPRTTKHCRCGDREHCDHAWVNADEGAGTMVKSTGKMHWAHKASTLSFANQEVLLDAVAVSDAACHDSRSLLPHLRRLFQRHPDLRDVVSRVLDDGAADDTQLKGRLQEELGVQLLTPINPRRRQPIRDNLPRGTDHLTARGVPVCAAGYPFELLGFRQATERFIFQAPLDAEGESVCQGCALRAGCYRGESGGRRVTIAAERLPWLDRELPQLSKRFVKAMSRRTVIERLHKLMKFDFGDDRLTKRGTRSFQARLDKTLLAMHVLLAHEC